MEKEYLKEKLLKDICELIPKMKKSLSKYPSSKNIKKQIEKVAPTIYDA